MRLLVMVALLLMVFNVVGISAIAYEFQPIQCFKQITPSQVFLFSAPRADNCQMRDGWAYNGIIVKDVNGTIVVDGA